MLQIKTSIIVIIAMLLYACNWENTDKKTTKILEEPAIPSLHDSLIPVKIKELVKKLEINGTKTLLISSSKWNLFGKQGIWLKTDIGIIDIVPIPSNIDCTLLKIEEIESESPTFFSYEIKYNDTLEQIIQGKETFFVIGEQYIYKSLEKPTVVEIRKIETSNN